jgi:HAD superfamily hydrolase (TIGR01509 family)
MLKAVLFDVDGTLVDSNESHVASWVEVFREFGIEVTADDIRGQIGKGGDQLKPVFMSDDDIERRGEAIDAARSKLFSERYQPRITPFRSVRALFERIRRDGRRIVLASSSKPEELEHSLGLIGARDLVDATTSSGDVERTKPHGDIFRAALDKLPGIGPDEAIVVGDTPYDAIAARRAGLRAVGLLCGGFPRAALEEAGCVAIFDDPEDLLRRYEASPLA